MRPLLASFVPNVLIAFSAYASVLRTKGDFGLSVLNSSVTSHFGFSASNANSGTLTQCYDNCSPNIDTSTVPGPGALAVLAVAAGCGRRRDRFKRQKTVISPKWLCQTRALG